MMNSVYPRDRQIDRERPPKERVEKTLLAYMIVPWRVMDLTRTGRNGPELPAGLVFDPLEWKPP